MVSLPLNHFQHLKRLAELRRCTLLEAINYLFKNVEPNPHNWIDEHWLFKRETRKIEITCSQTQLMEHIQGLPKNIRPVTDGFYLDKFEFFSEAQGLLGIVANGIKILDFEMATSRDKGVFSLVKDLLPQMSVEQFRVYNTFCSQYLRLIRQPELFTMPRKEATAIDAGCYVGYKALALANFIGDNDVLAFELAGDNFSVLKRNILLNPKYKIKPFEVALSNERKNMIINTRNERTMAHSLTSFNSLKEAQTSLLAQGEQNKVNKLVETCLLDDFTKNYKDISAIHISVNGHEPEVTQGALNSLKKADIIRISCPYNRDDKPIFDTIWEFLDKNNISIFGKSGAAVIAGKELGNYHVEDSNKMKNCLIFCLNKQETLLID